MTIFKITNKHRDIYFIDVRKFGKIEIISSGFDRIPNNLKEISNEDREENEKLLEMIENDDDVQNVFHNMKD